MPEYLIHTDCASISAVLSPQCVAIRSLWWKTFRMAKSESEEPMLTFKLSDETEFRCSVCHDSIASVRNGRIVVVGLPDLIAAFRDHLARYRTKKEDVSQAAARMGGGHRAFIGVEKQSWHFFRRAR